MLFFQKIPAPQGLTKNVNKTNICPSLEFPKILVVGSIDLAEIARANTSWKKQEIAHKITIFPPGLH
jgi:hypothetical protein